MGVRQALAGLDDVLVGDVHAGREHDRRGAVFLGRELHRTCHVFFAEIVAGDDETQVDVGEHLRLGLGALALHLDSAVGDVLARFLEDMHHVHRAAAADRQQHHLHGAETGVLAANVRGAVDGHDMAAVGRAAKLQRVLPVDGRLH